MEQQIADYLIKLEKRITDQFIIFPSANSKLALNVQSVDGSEAFLLDINRSGMIKISRCTFQERYEVNIGLVRLDLDNNKPHRNPDDTVINGPHIHIYKEGYGTKWAYPITSLTECPFTLGADFITIFIEFCEYCNIKNIPNIQGSCL